jgi:RHS repeat-associated protein
MLVTVMSPSKKVNLRGPNQGQGDTRYKFTQKERDVESQYDYFGARYYDSRVGRYLCPDPLDYLEPDESPFVYVSNNPIVLIDRTGMSNDSTNGIVLDEVVVTAERGPVRNTEAVCQPTSFLGGVFSDMEYLREYWVHEGGQWWRIQDRTSTRVVTGYPPPVSPTGINPKSLWSSLANLKGLLARLRILLRGGVAKPQVTDPKLYDIIKDLYHGTMTSGHVGTGSTADAVRFELMTGQQVGEHLHTTKAERYVRALENWLGRTPGASQADRAAASEVLEDLKNALGGK